MSLPRLQPDLNAGSFLLVSALSALSFETPVTLHVQCPAAAFCVARNLWGHVPYPHPPRADLTDYLLKFLSLGPQVFGMVTDNWSSVLAFHLGPPREMGILSPDSVYCVSHL
ncbi:hypothetical protein I79_001220 [Cricetulus griseus]|uniref:Uncharacterized protein n=1 Tax=Cricetulus griseus TaxID=10029 RepID=G3GU68_CRIGR|nr:hypothetical protein I79_001220 [Cricetulus griseus]